MAYEIQMLSRLISVDKAFADVPFIMVRGMPITPREALVMLQRGEAVQEITYAISVIGTFQPQQVWRLVEDYYRRLLQLPRTPPKIYRFEYEMTFEEALIHVISRDAIGQELVKPYPGLLREMARRMK